MGEVTIPLNIKEEESIWYKVGTGSEEPKCKNAIGEIQVKLLVEDAVQMT